MLLWIGKLCWLVVEHCSYYRTYPGRFRGCNTGIKVMTRLQVVQIVACLIRVFVDSHYTNTHFDNFADTSSQHMNTLESVSIHCTLMYVCMYIGFCYTTQHNTTSWCTCCYKALFRLLPLSIYCLQVQVFMRYDWRLPVQSAFSRLYPSNNYLNFPLMPHSGWFFLVSGSTLAPQSLKGVGTDFMELSLLSLVILLTTFMATVISFNKDEQYPQL